MLAAVVASTFVSGCGGSGGSSAPSPFAGQWTGADGFGGSFDVIVDSTGQMSGSDSSGGTWTGSISNGGNENGTYRSADGSIIVTLSGIATINSAGHLVGSGTAKVNGTSQPYTQDWTKS